ncbi:MAG: hypothetical protein SFU98_20195 [Leptospiraceae bacterium]|nr:hypothetical protein [Leptospiraceae bacterium]
MILLISYKLHKDSLFPIAFLGFLFHKHLQVFATSGLETSIFITFILLGTNFALSQKSIHQSLISSLCFVCASLVRPDGILFLFFLGLNLLILYLSENLLKKDIFRKLIFFLLPILFLYLPYFIWRFQFYGWMFPNTYYAKSGNSSNWEQGIFYFLLYFKSYYSIFITLILVILFNFKKILSLSLNKLTINLIFLFLFPSLTYIFYYTKVGGDFMFARFYLPVMPLLFIIIEFGILGIENKKLKLAIASFFLLGIIFYYNPYKGKPIPSINDISEENEIYKLNSVKNFLNKCENWKQHFVKSNVRIAIGGANAVLAYCLNSNYVLEASTGLTDSALAHSSIALNGRIGHEKKASLEYLLQKKIHIHWNGAEFGGLNEYNQIYFDSIPGVARIIIYDKEIMNELKKIPEIHFQDFDSYLENYISKIKTIPKDKIKSDLLEFDKYYFNQNPNEKKREVIEKFLNTKNR